MQINRVLCGAGCVAVMALASNAAGDIVEFNFSGEIIGASSKSKERGA